MKSYWKKKWLEALKAGGYKKAHGALGRVRRDDDDKPYRCYCAIGVLAHTIANSRSPSADLFKEETDRDKLILFGGTGGYLTDAQRAVAGLTEEDELHVAGVSDETPKDNFGAVIDYIEKNL